MLSLELEAKDGPVRWDLRIWEVGGFMVSVVYDGIYFCGRGIWEIDSNC